MSNVPDKNAIAAYVEGAKHDPVRTAAFIQKYGRAWVDAVRTDDHDHGAIHMSACYDRVDIVTLLLKNGATVDLQDSYGNTGLICACSNGAAKTAQLLLEWNADISIVNKNGVTPLITAITNGRVETVAVLIANGVDVKAVDNEGRTMRDLAMARFIQYMDSMHNEGPRQILQMIDARLVQVAEEEKKAAHLAEMKAMKKRLNVSGAIDGLGQITTRQRKRGNAL